MTEELIITKKRKRDKIQLLDERTPRSVPKDLASYLSSLSPGHNVRTSETRVQSFGDAKIDIQLPMSVPAPEIVHTRSFPVNLGSLSATRSVALRPALDESSKSSSASPNQAITVKPVLTVETFLRRKLRHGSSYAAKSRRQHRHVALKAKSESKKEPQSKFPSRKRRRTARAKKTVARRLLEAAVTTGVDLPANGPCAPADDRRPLPFQSLSNRSPLISHTDARWQAIGEWDLGVGVQQDGARSSAGIRRRGVGRIPMRRYTPLTFIPLDEHEAAWKARGSGMF